MKSFIQNQAREKKRTPFAIGLLNVSLCLVLISFSGCHFSWVSRKPDLRSVWGNYKSYNRLAVGYERRHLLPASNWDIDHYRWLHGPTTLIPSASVIGAGQPTNGQEQGVYNLESTLPLAPLAAPLSTRSPGDTYQSPLLPESDRMTEQGSLTPPATTTPQPQSSRPETQKENIPLPVEIVIPPTTPPWDQEDQNHQHRDQENRSLPRLPQLKEPANAPRDANLIHSAGYRKNHATQKASLPSASMIFARP